MEYKEIDFLINNNGKKLSVDCNIEDNLNKIDHKEITVLVVKLVMIGISKMKMEIASKIEYEEEREVILRERIESFIKAEIFQILDYLDFLETSNKGRERNNLNYSLHVYKKNKDQKLNIESYHYSNISVKEIITSNYLIYKDVADKMLKEKKIRKRLKEKLEKY